MNLRSQAQECETSCHQVWPTTNTQVRFCRKLIKRRTMWLRSVVTEHVTPEAAAKQKWNTDGHLIEKEPTLTCNLTLSGHTKDLYNVFLKGESRESVTQPFRQMTVKWQHRANHGVCDNEVQALYRQKLTASITGAGLTCSTAQNVLVCRKLTGLHRQPRDTGNNPFPTNLQLLNRKEKNMKYTFHSLYFKFNFCFLPFPLWLSSLQFLDNSTFPALFLQHCSCHTWHTANPLLAAVPRHLSPSMNDTYTLIHFTPALYMF